MSKPCNDIDEKEIFDLLRWRNAKLEPPTERTDCIVILANGLYADVATWTKESPWTTGIITHWRPIGPLPKGDA